MNLDRTHQKINQWLSAPDPSTNLNKALQQRQKGTGQWFLQSDTFSTWRSRPKSAVWLYGIPGCGKTILSSSIVTHLRSLPDLTLVYFYFDFNDASKQTLQGLVRSLISQLYYAPKGAQKPLEKLFSSCSNGITQPSDDLLCDVLTEMIEQTEEVWIILDALDECATRKGHATAGVVSWVCSLIRSTGNTHLLVTSRPEHDIRVKLNDCIEEHNRVSIQSHLVKDDISAYVRTRVRNDEELQRWQGHPDVQEEIEQTLTDKANGMYVRQASQSRTK